MTCGSLSVEVRQVYCKLHISSVQANFHGHRKHQKTVERILVQGQPTQISAFRLCCNDLLELALDGASPKPTDVIFIPTVLATM